MLTTTITKRQFVDGDYHSDYWIMNQHIHPNARLDNKEDIKSINDSISNPNRNLLIKYVN